MHFNWSPVGKEIINNSSNRCFFLKLQYDCIITTNRTFNTVIYQTYSFYTDGKGLALILLWMKFSEMLE